MYYNYLYAGQISFSFLTINILNYHNLTFQYTNYTQDIKISTTETVRNIKILVSLGLMNTMNIRRIEAHET